MECSSACFDTRTQIRIINPIILEPNSRGNDRMVPPTTHQTTTTTDAARATPQNDTTATATGTHPCWSKRERGRWRKLQRRANTIVPTLHRSGLRTTKEWNEWQALHTVHLASATTTTNTTAVVHPYVHVAWRNGHARTMTDASSHRDLLRQCGATSLQASNAPTTNTTTTITTPSSNKRKRHEPSSAPKQQTSSHAVPTFGWASVHNLPCVQRTAVLELHVATPAQADDLASHMAHTLGRVNPRPSAKATTDGSSSTTTTTTTSVLSAPVQWFPDTCRQARSMTEALLYDTRVRHDDRKDDPQSSPNSTTTTRPLPHSTTTTEKASTPKDSDTSWLYAQLSTLVATRQQLLAEGYPLDGMDMDHPTDDVGSNDRTRDENITDAKNPVAHTGHHETTPRLAPAHSPPFSYRRPQDIAWEDACVAVAAAAATPSVVPYVVAPSTPDARSTTRRQVYGMDCEMVETKHGLELARVTLVRLLDRHECDNNNNNSGRPPKKKESRSAPTEIETQVVFDTLVRPRNAILNYLTQYSGMTAALLGENGSTRPEHAEVCRIEQVQAALLQILHPDDIVVGHSLENDLRAVRFQHATVIDTALVFQHRGQTHKSSLRHLALVLMKKRIQNPHSPHCSEEDAVTALELAVRRATEGRSFGLWSTSRSSHCHWVKEESSLSSNTPVVYVGPTAWLQRHVLAAPASAAHALSCDSVSDTNTKALVSWFTSKRRPAGIVWGSLTLRSPTTTAATTGKESDTTTPPSSFETGSLCHSGDIKDLTALLENIQRNFPAQGVLLVAIQAGLDAAEKLSQKRKIGQSPRTTLGWTEQEEEAWSESLRICQKGHALWIGSQHRTE